MSMHGVTTKIVLRYVFIQTLETCAFIGILLLVQNWVAIPSWLFVCLVVVWIVKDGILFPFVWRAYDWDHHEEANPMVGMLGVVQERLDPGGYILVRGELWHAEVDPSSTMVEKGASVRVVGRNGLTLFVKPENDQE